MEKEDLKFSVNNYLNMIYNNIKIEKNQQEKKLINENAYRSSQLFTTSLFEEIIGKENEKNGKLRNELIELKANTDNFIDGIFKKSLNIHNENIYLKKKEIIEYNNRRQSIDFVNSLVSNLKNKNENINLLQDTLEEEKNVVIRSDSKKETKKIDNAFNTSFKVSDKIWNNLVSIVTVNFEIKQKKNKFNSFLEIEENDKFSYRSFKVNRVLKVQNFYLKIQGKKRSLGISEEINFSLGPIQIVKKNTDPKISSKMEKYNSFSNYKIAIAETNIDNTLTNTKIPYTVLNKSKIEEIKIKESRNIVKLNDLSLNKSLNNSKIHSSKVPLIINDTRDVIDLGLLI